MEGPQQVTVQHGGNEVVVVYGGPRGRRGLPGGDGEDGLPGASITVRGAWNNALTYVRGDAVQSRTLASPGLQALWIVKEDGEPTVGFPPHLQPSQWVEISSTSTSADGAIYRVTQINHPFTAIGQPAAFSATTGRYELADARDPGLLAMGLICEILGPEDFAFQMTGRMNNVDRFLIFDPSSPAERGLQDWVPGTTYYLSTVPGMVQVASPRAGGAIEMPLVTPINEDGDLLILTWGPSIQFPPASVGPLPAPRREGEQAYRTDAYPGLYIALFDATRTQLMWVQTNG